MGRRFPLALAMILLAGMEVASACSYAPGHGPPTDEELFSQASTVFVGHVFRVEKAGLVRERELLAFPPWWKEESRPPKTAVESMPPIPAIEATFRIVEVFKGEPPTDSKIRAPIYMHCVGPMLLAGADHVFFLHEGNFVRSWLEGRTAYNRPTPEQDAERMDGHVDLAGQSLHFRSRGKGLTACTGAFEKAGTTISRQAANRALDPRKSLGQVGPGEPTEQLNDVRRHSPSLVVNQYPVPAREIVHAVDAQSMQV